MKIPFPPKRILAAVDLSLPSLAALKAAKRMAKQFSANLELVYIEPPAGSPIGLPSGLEDAAVASLRRRLRDQRRGWRERLSLETEDLPPGSVSLRWLRGWPAEALPRLAALRTADLVVTGTHGYRGADRVFFGSIAETLTRHARIPVLSIHENARLDLGAGILVPHHRRPYADDAMLYALELAKSAASRVTALYVAGPGEWEVDASALLQGHIDRTFGTEAARACRLLVRRGEPRAEMLAEAEEGRYGLVVLSSHVRPFSPDILLGSTAERVLRRSPVPVLAVPSQLNWKDEWTRALGTPTLLGW